MPETDTAVMEPDTAPEAAPSEATQEFTTTEVSEPDPSAEVEQPQDTETVEAAEATETAGAPSLSELIKDLSEDDLRDIPEFKSLLAREGESMRQRTERETAAKLAQQRDEYVATGKAFEDLQGLLINAEVDDKGRPSIDQSKFEDISGALTSHGAANAVNVFASVLNELTGPEFAFTDDEKAVAEAALVKYQQNPRDPSALIKAWLKPYARAESAASEADIRKDEAKKVRAEYAAQQKAAQAKQATDGRKEQPGATSVTGGPGGAKYTSQAAVDAAHVRGDLSTDDYLAMRMNGEYARLS